MTVCYEYCFNSAQFDKIIKKNAQFVWDNLQNKAFNNLEQVLIERPTVAVYDARAETELHTEASKLGIGGTLLQRQSDKTLRPVMYFSRQTTKKEQRYHS